MDFEDHTRVLRITSYAGHSRYLAKVGYEAAGYITRHPEIPSPYAWGPTHMVYRDEKHGLVFIVETAHKRYDVFKVPEGDTLYKSDEEATHAFIASRKEPENG